MDRPIKGGDILISRKGEILEKKGGGMTPLTNYEWLCSLETVEPHP